MDAKTGEQFSALQQQGKALASQCEKYLSAWLCKTDVDTIKRERDLPCSHSTGSEKALAATSDSSEGIEQGSTEKAEEYWRRCFFSQLVSHVRLVLERSASVIRPYEGLLWGDGSTRDGNRNDTTLLSSLLLLLDTLNSLRAIEKTIWSTLPGVLQSSSRDSIHTSIDDPVGAPEGDIRKRKDFRNPLLNEEGPSSLVPAAPFVPLEAGGYERLSDEEALHIALLLRSVTLFQRDIYLLLSFSEEYGKPNEKISPASALSSSPASHRFFSYSKRRELAKGLTLLRQGHQAVNLETFASAMPSLLLPYAPAKEVLRFDNEANRKQEYKKTKQKACEKEHWDLVSLDPSFKTLYRHVLRYTKEVYKAESRISLFAYELLQVNTPVETLGQTLFSLAHRVLDEFDLLRGAQNDIQLGVLYAFTGDYESSAKRNQKAVKVLASFHPKEKEEENVHSVGDPVVPNGLHHLSSLLLPVALFNLACVKHLLSAEASPTPSPPVGQKPASSQREPTDPDDAIPLFWRAYEQAMALPNLVIRTPVQGPLEASPTLPSPFSPLIQSLVDRLGGAARVQSWLDRSRGHEDLRLQRETRRSDNRTTTSTNEVKDSALFVSPAALTGGAIVGGDKALVARPLPIEQPSSFSVPEKMTNGIPRPHQRVPNRGEAREGEEGREWGGNTREGSKTNWIPAVKPLKPPHHLPRVPTIGGQGALPTLLTPDGAFLRASSVESRGGESSLVAGSVTIPPAFPGGRGPQGARPTSTPPTIPLPSPSTISSISSASIPPFLRDSKEEAKGTSTASQAAQGGPSPVMFSSSPVTPTRGFTASHAVMAQRQHAKKSVELKQQSNAGSAVGRGVGEVSPVHLTSRSPSWVLTSECSQQGNEKAADTSIAAPLLGDERGGNLSLSHLPLPPHQWVSSLPPPPGREIPSLSSLASKRWSLSSAGRGISEKGMASDHLQVRGKRSIVGESGSESTGGSGSGETHSSTAYRSFTSFYQRVGKSTSVLSTLLSCHRLERPDDALSLAGPQEDYIPPNKAKEAELQREKEVADQRKRERRIRSFLPEDIERKQKKMEAKQERQQKRQRHEEKKKYFAKKMARDVARRGQHAKMESTSSFTTFRRYSSLATGSQEDGQGEQNSVLSSDAFSQSHEFRKMARHRKTSKRMWEEDDAVLSEGSPAESSVGEEAAGEAGEAGASALLGGRRGSKKSTDDSLQKGTRGRDARRRSVERDTEERAWNTGDGGNRWEEEGVLEGTRTYLRKRNEADVESQKTQRSGSGSYFPFSNEDANLQNSKALRRIRRHSNREGDREDSDGYSIDSDCFSSLSSHSLPPSSADGSDDKPNSDEEDDETAEERKERYHIEMQLYFFGTHRKREKAAHVIQRAWRCSVARLELYNRRQYFYQQLYIRQKAAAMCIAGFVRSTLMQRRMQTRLADRVQENTQRVELERRELAAVQIIERTFIRYWARKLERERLREELNLVRDIQLSQYEAAAVIIQRWWRIIPPIHAYWVLRGEEVRKQREEEEQLASRTTAAIRIQALVRGRQVRRYVRRYRLQRSRERLQQQERLIWSTELVKLSLTEWCLRAKRLDQAARFEEQREYEAVKRITEGWQAALANRRFQLALTKARQMRMAAETIQRALKRFYAGRERRYLREISITAEKERIDHEFLIYRATLKLQCFARVVVAKAAYRRQRARYGRGVAYALMILQSVGRGFLVRREFNVLRLTVYQERRLQAERAAQTWQRHKEVWECFLLAKASAVLKVQRACDRLTNKLFIRLLVRRELKREKAAVKIQKAFRRYLVLKREFMQEYQQHCAEEAALMAVVKIQCAWRQWQSRREVRRRRWLAFKTLQKRDIQEEILASQWVTDFQYFLREFEHEQRRITNLENDIREHLLWRHQKALKALWRAAGAPGSPFSGAGHRSEEEEEELPPMNVTVALEGCWDKAAAFTNDSWCSLYAED